MTWNILALLVKFWKPTRIDSKFSSFYLKAAGGIVVTSRSQRGATLVIDVTIRFMSIDYSFLFENFENLFVLTKTNHFLPEKFWKLPIFIIKFWNLWLETYLFLSKNFWNFYLYWLKTYSFWYNNFWKFTCYQFFSLTCYQFYLQNFENLLVFDSKLSSFYLKAAGANCSNKSQQQEGPSLTLELAAFTWKIWKNLFPLTRNLPFSLEKFWKTIRNIAFLSRKF